MFYTERFYINKSILHADFYLHFSDDDYRYKQWLEYKQGKGDKIVNTIDELTVGSIVYCDLHNYNSLPVLNSVNVPFILITAMDDDTIPFNNYYQPSNIGYELLKNKNLVKWYSTNVDNSIKSHKLVGIPIGISFGIPYIVKQNTSEDYMVYKYDINQYDTVDLWFKNKNINIQERLCTKGKKLLHIKMTVQNSCASIYPKTDKINCREKALVDLEKNGFDVSNVKEKLDWHVYMEDLYDYKFCLAFPGHGFDCFRIWECLNMGVIPIILRSNICELYDDLPVLIVNDASEITENFLEIKYNEICNSIRNYRYNKLYFEYWVSKLLYDKYQIINL